VPIYSALVTGEDRLENAQYAMTLDEIGAELGVSRERVRQILNKALRKLKNEQMPTLLKMRELATELRKRRGPVDAHGVIL
jgi:DNA-directed RNA polymerase sigma subunit (sigma70/sigma32)